MTAIAGLIGAYSTSVQSLCEAMLVREPGGGHGYRSVRQVGAAVFGTSNGGDSGSSPVQPAHTAGRHLLAADARLDNRAELAAALGGSGGRSSAPSQLLLDAWCRWGISFLDRIVGDFAIALWDGERQQLILARDPTGQRPLFFASTAEGVAFSSTPAGLLGFMRGRSAWAFPNLAASMIGLDRFSQDSFFKGIYRVLPGHVAIYSKSEFTQRPYWMPPDEELRLKPGEYLQAYRHHLDCAVGDRLDTGGGQLGAHLSAGYDSSAVAATAARLSADKAPIAFTCAPREGFDGPVPAGRLADESSIAAVAARQAGMKHVVVRPDRGVLTGLRRIARLYQDPALNLVNMEWWTQILGEARQRGVSVMLVGVMGNLSINASGLSILPQWIRDRRILAWFSQARAAAARPDVRWRGVLYNSFWEQIPAGISTGLQSHFRKIPPPERQSFFRREWWPHLPAGPSPGPPSSVRYPDRLSAIRSLDVGLLRKGALADTGIEERDALADRRLLDFSFALPPEQLLDQGEYHPLARRALADRVPAELLDLRLRGLQGADWYERFDKVEAHCIVEQLKASHAATELLDLERIDRMIDRWPAEGTVDPGLTVLFRMRLLMALSTGVFVQEFEGDVSG